VKEIGTILFILGALFTFFAFRTKSYEKFIFQIVFGPILIFIGLQILIG
jgi:Na+/phosphate symporter